MINIKATTTTKPATTTTTETTESQTLERVLACRYPGCRNGVYKDARILPCLNRTCSEHIEAMRIVNNDCGADEEVENDFVLLKGLSISNNKEPTRAPTQIRCYFCAETHECLGEYPRDLIIDHLFHNVNFGDQHTAAKSKWREVTSTMARLGAVCQSADVFVHDYFRQVEERINTWRQHLTNDNDNGHLLCEELIRDVRVLSATCLTRLQASESATNCELARVQTFSASLQAANDAERYEYDLQTLNGNDAKWSNIQVKCRSILPDLEAVEFEVREKLLAEEWVEFECDANGGRLERVNSSTAIDSLALGTLKNKCDLLKLCAERQASGFQHRHSHLTLLYRASRDGFAAKHFHAACDDAKRTLTIIRTKPSNGGEGYIFGGYTEQTWKSNPRHFVSKRDPKAFIFSLTNQSNRPLIMPSSSHFAISCEPNDGPSFAEAITISENLCFSTLGLHYGKTLFKFNSPESRTFLAGKEYFEPAEIEVFLVN